MNIDAVRCPFCNEFLAPTYIDIGIENEDPNFLLGLTCDCDSWLDLEMNKSIALSTIYEDTE